MGSFTSGEIVLVLFPFSDLSSAKLRPAVVIAEINSQDWLLCQITSNHYSDPGAIMIDTSGLIKGSLQRISYVRPYKLFTANNKIIKSSIGQLEKGTFEKIIKALNELLTESLLSYK